MAFCGKRISASAAARTGASGHPRLLFSPPERKGGGHHPLSGGLHRPCRHPWHREHRRRGYRHCGRGAGGGLLDVVLRPVGDGYQIRRGAAGGGIPHPGSGGPLAGRAYGISCQGAGDALAGGDILPLLRPGLLRHRQRHPGGGGGPDHGPGFRPASLPHRLRSGPSGRFGDDGGPAANRGLYRRLRPPDGPPLSGNGGAGAGEKRSRHPRRPLPYFPLRLHPPGSGRGRGGVYGAPGGPFWRSQRGLHQ